MLRFRYCNPLNELRRRPRRTMRSVHLRESIVEMIAPEIPLELPIRPSFMSPWGSKTTCVVLTSREADIEAARRKRALVTAPRDHETDSKQLTLLSIPLP